MSLPPQCTASIPHGNRFRQAFSAGRRSLPLRHASVPTGQSGLSGDIVHFLYSKRSGTPSVPLWAGFDALWAGLFSGERAIAWKLISLLVIFFYLFNSKGFKWVIVVLGGKL